MRPDKRDPVPSNPRVISICLIGVAVALLVVGVVSGTFLRHVVQILPVILAVVVVDRRPHLGAYTALPIFVFWALIMLLIWLFLLGISRIANGNYTVVEIICTLFIAGFSVCGIVKAMAVGKALRPLRKMLAFATFAALQVAAMWVSFLPSIVNR